MFLANDQERQQVNQGKLCPECWHKGDDIEVDKTPNRTYFSCPLCSELWTNEYFCD
jgi:hypothetical protein